MHILQLVTILFFVNQVCAVEISNVNPPYDNDSLLPNGQKVDFKLTDNEPVKIIRVSNVGINERLLISHIRTKNDDDIDITVRDKNDKIIGDYRVAKKDNGGMISAINEGGLPFIVYYTKTKLGDVDVKCYFSLYSVQQIEKALKIVEDLR